MKLGKFLSSLSRLELEELKENCIFTEEELEIMKLATNRSTNIEIAERLNMSIATLERRFKEIKEKIEKNKNCKKIKIPVCEKLLLTIEEASEYSNIDRCKIEELIKNQGCTFALSVDKNTLIKRKYFEIFTEKSVNI